MDAEAGNYFVESCLYEMGEGIWDVGRVPPGRLTCNRGSAPFQLAGTVGECSLR